MLKTKEVKLVSENPFYNLRSTLDLFQEAPKMVKPNKSHVALLLTRSWQEINAIKEQSRKNDAIEMFFSIVFAIGDVTNREHQMFGKSKVDAGGMGSREAFRYALEWMLQNTPDTFYKVIHLIPEYSNYENLFFNQIRTDRYKGTVLSQDFLNVDYVKIANALAKKVKDKNTSEFELSLIAKFLPKVPVNKRYRINKAGEKVAREKQTATISKDTRTLKLIETFSKAMDFEIKLYDNNIRFIGYEKFRSKYLKGTEAQLFSSKEIVKFDKTQFEDFLTALPAGARYRVQRRLIDKTKDGKLVPLDKWKLNSGENMGQLFLNWEKNKEAAMKLLVSMSETEKDKMDAKDLKKLEKAAKVNTGGVTLYQVLIDFMRGINTPGANLLAQSLLDKIKLEVPVMVVSDVSGSMTGSYGSTINVDGVRITPLDVAKLATSIFLYKNPNPDLQSMFIRFDSQVDVVMDGSKGIAKSNNRFMQGRETIVSKLSDTTKPFMDTYRNVAPQLFARGGTHFNIVADQLYIWAKADGQDVFNIRREMIQQYPVWLVVSDGDMNGSGSATSTMREFQMKMKQYFGFEPVVVVWDVTQQSVLQQNSKFKDLENVMYFGGFNPQILNQVFLNINDIDIIDIYTPLKSMFLSNRYQPVRDVIAGRTKAVKSKNITEEVIEI